jgi:sugar lactone lactonase YvrE
MGGLVVALRDGFGILADGHLQMVAPVEADLPDNRMNDGKCDPAGRYLAGTMHLDELLGRGALYRLNSDLSVDRLITGVTISNGLAWSIDGRLMYYIDSPTQRVDAFDYDTESGELSNRRPFVHISPDIGAPDGMTLDSEGCLWVALFDGGAVHRFTPDGALETVVELPTRQITSCAFGGDRLDVLYITTARIGRSADPLDPVAGGLFACEPGVTGLPTHYFNG